MSDLTIRELHELDELQSVFALFGEIWGAAPGSEPITVELMRALSHAGNYIAGAYRQGRLVAATAAFFGSPVGESMHSHVTGALPGHAGGFALKLHQREWALARGLTRITWTYDPLIRRNAYFNLAKLGGRPAEYLQTFYGTMDDAINGGDDTDRVLVAWDLNDPHVVAAARSTPIPVPVPADARHALYERDSLPVLGRTDGDTLLVDVPADIEALRRTDPGAAKAWRLALREVLGGLLADGAHVTGFHNKTSYVVARGTSA
ncbi:GNAT family N-acetyltransferase [Embleya sp. NBC_00896]|uniref:GNAT family N-acetyltransferase n=1 Tax=Embleya sp. NBC_00896 TaxID=2975961 RepID=UPI002F917DCB|nr:GNAT family N-acetyltransferase [Embleya sp. NBC_00896]